MDIHKRTPNSFIQRKLNLANFVRIKEVKIFVMYEQFSEYRTTNSSSLRDFIILVLNIEVFQIKLS